MDIYMYIYVYIHTRVYVYIFLLYIYMYIYIYIYTYNCTEFQRGLDSSLFKKKLYILAPPFCFRRSGKY